MSIDPKQLRFLIQSELTSLDPALATDDAVEMLMLTAAAETQCGRWLWQVTSGGPFTKHAYGIFQMEEAGFQDACSVLMRRKPDYHIPERETLITDLRLAIWTTRCYYLRFIEPFPTHKDVYEMAKYWKKYWNTPRGAGTASTAESLYFAHAVER